MSLLLRRLAALQREPRFRRWRESLSLFILILIGVLAARLFWRLAAPRMDFYNELWGPAYLLVHGQSPYDTASLAPVLPAAWFPMAIGLFFPLGWLGETLALRVWFLLNIAELCALIYFAQGAERSPWRTLAFGFLCFFFPPVINHLSLGQISITIALSVILAARLLESNRLWPAAILIALAFSKPHLAFLPMLGLTAYLFGRDGWMSALGWTGRVAAAAAALTLPLFVAEPAWIPDALASMARNPFWLYPSLFIVFRRFVPGWEYVLWGITLAAATFAVPSAFKRLPLHKAVNWSLALGLLASPYVGSWDFVLILPLFFDTLRESDWRGWLFLSISYVLAWAGMAFVQIQPGSDNHFFWWVPVWFVGVVWLTTKWNSEHRAGDLRP